MRIIVPSGYSVFTIEHDGAPANLSAQVLAGAVVHYMESSWGYALSQCVTGEQYKLWTHLISADETIVLHFYNIQKNFLLVAVPDSNGMIVDGKPDDSFLFPAPGFARLVYAPGGKEYKAHFRKNSQVFIYYISLSFQFVEHALAHFKDRQDSLAFLLQAYISGSNTVTQMGDIRLTAEQAKMLLTLKNELDHSGSTELWLAPAVRLLLWWYLSKLENKTAEMSARNASFRVSVHEVEAVMRVAELIAKELHNNYTVAVLAEKAGGMSVKRLRRVFTYHFKCTLHRFRHERIMEEGLFLLNVKNMSVKAVALQLGYASASDFGKAFQRFYGIPPTDMKAGK